MLVAADFFVFNRLLHIAFVLASKLVQLVFYPISDCVPLQFVLLRHYGCGLKQVFLHVHEPVLTLLVLFLTLRIALAAYFFSARTPHT